MAGERHGGDVLAATDGNDGGAEERVGEADRRRRQDEDRVAGEGGDDGAALGHHVGVADAAVQAGARAQRGGGDVIVVAMGEEDVGDVFARALERAEEEVEPAPLGVGAGVEQEHAAVGLGAEEVGHLAVHAHDAAVHRIGRVEAVAADAHERDGND